MTHLCAWCLCNHLYYIPQQILYKITQNNHTLFLTNKHMWHITYLYMHKPTQSHRNTYNEYHLYIHTQNWCLTLVIWILCFFAPHTCNHTSHMHSISFIFAFTHTYANTYLHKNAHTILKNYLNSKSWLHWKNVQTTKLLVLKKLLTLHNCFTYNNSSSRMEIDVKNFSFTPKIIMIMNLWYKSFSLI